MGVTFLFLLLHSVPVSLSNLYNMLVLLQYLVIFILFQICHSYNDVLPNSGLVIGYTEYEFDQTNQPIILKILEKINTPVTCQSIRLNHSLSNVIKKNDHIFNLINENDIYFYLYEGYNIYKNRNNQYLSYISNGGAYGTWIIGDQPHVDNGLAYVRQIIMIILKRMIIGI